MMSEIVRRPSEQCSPKTSPRGNRSPVVVPRQDSTGTLKTTISLGKTPAIVHSGPFYLMKELPPPSELTGSTNLIQYHNLEHSFNKFCGRKIRDQLSAFLPNLPGNIDLPASQDDSSLRKMIERPPITAIEIVPFSKQQLDSAFRLHVGPVPEQYRFMSQNIQRKKHKHKKHKTKGPGFGDSPVNDILNDSTVDNLLTITQREHEKKHKKQKRHDEEKERRKKKKDKKKKKRHSPDSYDPIAMDDSPIMSSTQSIIAGPGTPNSTSFLTSNQLVSQSALESSLSSSVLGGTGTGFQSSSIISNGLNGSINSAANTGRPLL